MIGLRVDASRHRTDLRDSYALMPSSLRSLADELAPDLPKGRIDFDSETSIPATFSIGNTPNETFGRCSLCSYAFVGPYPKCIVVLYRHGLLHRLLYDAGSEPSPTAWSTGDRPPERPN